MKFLKSVIFCLIMALSLNIVGCTYTANGSVIQDVTFSVSYKNTDGEDVNVDATLSLYKTFAPKTCDHLLDYMKEKGYTAIKMGWGGFEQEMATEIKLVEASRKAVGDEIDMIYDIGYIPSPKVTIDAQSRIQLVKALEPYHPFAIEEALWPTDYEGYKRLAESTNTRIVCGENETTRYGFKQLIDYCKIAFVQPDITRCGGITEASRIASYAEINSTNVVPHCWSSGIVEAASLQIIASIPNAELLEYCEQDTPIRHDLVPDDIPCVNGYAKVPTKPGLGIEVDDKAIEFYRCDKY